MAMRLSGLMSGMDTESIIQELVAARRTKVDDTVKAQTKLEWKQEAWKGLNTKLKNLQAKYISNMRFEASYSKKTTSVSNTSAASVITGESAVTGVQTLKIDKLAKTAYLTGADITAENGTKYNALSKLSELGVTQSGVISLKSGGKTTDIEITADTTISDFLNQVKSAGLNASFDAKNQRIFVSAKESGEKYDFSFTASDANGSAALKALGLQVGLNSDKATKAEYEKYAGYVVDGDKDATIANMRSLIDATVSSKTNSYLSRYEALMNSKKLAQDKLDEIGAKYAKTEGEVVDYETTLQRIEDAIADKKSEIAAIDPENTEELKAAEEELAALEADAEALTTQQDQLKEINSQITDVEQYVTITATEGEEGKITYSAAATEKLQGDVENDYYQKALYAVDVLNDPAMLNDSKATKISGQDAVIYLNGAEFKNNTNVFEINGLTITALSETKEGENVTLTTQRDVNGIYDMIRDFLKEYNTLINEMDKLYNADSAKGFEPMTDEEKEAVSESEAEKYENKIKDALLRHDSNLGNISSALKSVMSGGIEVNGKMMYLSSFGINTLGYFTAADNEKNAYHIDGDENDASTSGNADVLKGMIASDPDTVISFFSQLSRNLYSKMDSLSSSVNGYRSFGSFYDDKKMKSDYTDYTTKIATLEEKLADYEDKWYAKFAEMETAMAKMQSNANAVTSLLGG